MTEVQDFNVRIIEEFRANEGKVGGPFEGAPVLLLHHVGARTGTLRVNPVVYLPVEGGYAVFASKGGQPHDPHWYLNLKAHPDVEVEIGTQTVPVTAVEVTGAERDAIFDRQKEAMPGFAEYEARTEGIRVIPVVILQPR